MKSRLTPEERKQAYEYMVEHYQGLGLCFEMVNWLEKYHPEVFIITRWLPHDVLRNYFPEIYAQKPENTGAYWWPAREKAPRITALQNALKLI